MTEADEDVDRDVEICEEEERRKRSKGTAWQRIEALRERRRLQKELGDD